MRLLPLEAVHAAHYNPRQTDPARLQYVRLSLRKLGFLLPIFAMHDGEIASGHQRHLAARQLGWTHIPVVHLKPLTDDERRSVNMLFNVATNDSNARTTAEQMFERLEALQFTELLEAMPDKEGDDRYPCLGAVDVPTSDLVAANSTRWSDFQRAGAASLAQVGGFQPIIATADLSIINGLGRLQFASERDWSTVPVVFVTGAEAALAEGLLNLLSMDFALEAFSADFLRHMAFRRASLKKQRLGAGIAHLAGLGSGYDLDPARSETAALLRQRLGPRILDFGSGRGEDAALLRQMGLDCLDFEPFVPFPDRDAVDAEASIAGGRRLLDAIATGTVWTSILLMSVLNSVPFATDRRHILTLTSALAASSTTVFATLMGVTNRWAELNAADGDHSAANAGGQMFVLNHEPRTTMSLKMNRPKVQHYFTKQETGDLFRAHFRDVTMQHKSHKWLVEARQPRGVSRTALREAIAFEFDVPLPGGRRMGLAEEAARAFEARLGLSL